MYTATQHAAPAAHLHARTHVHERQPASILVSVRKEMKPWRRVEFFIYLANQMAAHDPPVPDLQALADMANINPSTLSRWKNGHTRPNLDTLYAIADALKIGRAEVVDRSGIFDEERPATSGSPQDPNIARIRASRLPKAAQDKLIETYLAELAAQEARLKQSIEMLESLSGTSP